MRTTLLFTLLVGLLAANRVLADGDAGKLEGHAATTGSISGHVVDATKAPLPNAHVSLYKLDDVPLGFVPAVAKLKADDSGGFSFSGLAPSRYVMVAESDGLATSRSTVILLKGQQQNLEVALRPAVHAQVRFQSESGQPIAGVKLRDLRYRNINGDFYPYSPASQNLATLGLNAEVSGADGLMTLPALAEGTVIIAAIFDHADFAPVMIKDVPATNSCIATAPMYSGVKLTLKVVSDSGGRIIDNPVLRLVHSDQDNPSTIVDSPIPLRDDGTATVTVEAGKYSLVRLEHDDDIITPVYEPRSVDSPFEIGPGINDTLVFTLRSTVQARGRVVESDTFKPAGPIGVYAEAPNQPTNGWTYVARANANAEGQYILQVPAGRIRISIISDLTGGNHMAMSKPFVEAEVRADGSTILPDIKLIPIPMISGRVVDPDGKPVAGAIVRLQGVFRLGRWPPAATKSDGRFELIIKYMPDIDLASSQVLDVFHPTKPLSLRTEIHFDQPKSLADMNLQLKPEGYEEFLRRSVEPVAEDERDRIARIAERNKSFPSAIGQPAPELDGLAWLNTDKPTMKLSDFRGKYVLLDFWAVWCGPCHGDFPEIKLLYDTYKDRNFVLIGVHDNSTEPELVRQHAKEQGLVFPIVVDQRDGRTFSAYQKYGIGTSIPSYVLIGPDGNILQTGVYQRFEYVRSYLFGTGQSP
jgi:thiol-disulfide isomerase/thioredoxin